MRWPFTLHVRGDKLVCLATVDGKAMDVQPNCALHPTADPEEPRVNGTR